MSASTLSNPSGGAALSGSSPSADDFLLCRRTTNNNNDEAEPSPPSRKAALWAPSQHRPELQQQHGDDSNDEDSRAATPTEESEEEAQVAPLAATAAAPTRNKRKNFKPRNILYSLDDENEAGETAAKSQKPLDLTDGLLPAKRRSTILPRRLERSQMEAARGDVIDLSVRPQDDDEQPAVDLSNEARNVQEALMAQQYAHIQSQLHAHLQTFQQHPELLLQQRHTSPADASAMREYAENTMKELLGIYGLNDMAESITKHVPIGNFSSGEYLSCYSLFKNIHQSILLVSSKA
jgi:hypothetical protein